MDTNKMREQFEVKFQTPNGMVWCNVAKQYVKALGCICPETAIAAHNQLWKCWQASRESVVVNPAWPDHYEYTNSDVAGAAVLDCRSAFQKAMRAQGLKVKP